MTTAAKTITPCPPGFSDQVYKVAHDVSVPLRVWPARESASKPAPWLYWVHGGGFLAGKHVVPNAWMSEAFGSRGYHIVSVAYRFSPQCGMEDQLSDCADALKWCLSHLPSILAASNIDINRYVIAGDSAGGTIATQCAHLFDLKPKAVIDVYGAVSMTDPWYHVVRRDGLNVNKTEYLEAREDAEMQKAIEDRNPANAEVMSPWDWELEPKMSVTQLQSFVCPTTCQQRKISSGWI